MADTTPNIGLKKPLESEFVDIGTLNGNMDTIDRTFGAMNEVPTASKNVSGAIAEIHDHLASKPSQQLTLKNGVQIVQGGDVPAILHPTMKGRTLVNLLGRDGNCEDANNWVTIGATKAVDSTTKKYGLSSIKLTLSGSNNILKKQLSGLTVGGNYLLVAEALSRNTLDIFRLSFKNSDLTDGTRDATFPFGVLSDWQTGYITFSPTVTNPYIGFYAGGGSAGQIANVDGVRVYEITASEKGFIDTKTIDEAQAYISANYPYVDDMKHVNAVYIENKGQNLVDNNVSAWSGISALNISPEGYLYKTGNSGYDGYQEVVIGGGSTYTLSALGYASSNDGKPAYLNMEFRDASNNIISTPYTLTWAGVVTPTRISLATTAPPEAARARIYPISDSTSNKTVYFKDVMLNMGAQILPFETQKPSYFYLPDCNLRSNVDGTVADQLYTDVQGKPRVTRRFREVVLDGALGWALPNDFKKLGFKQVYVPNFMSNHYPNSSDKTQNFGKNIAIKFDGKKLKEIGSTGEEADTFVAAASNLFFSISNADSGWGESYTPTSEEIKAYFNGWKMYNGDSTDQSTQYNGTGTKKWIPRKDYGLTFANVVSAVPTVMSNSFTPYRLMYQLSQSVDEPVTYEGSLMLHEGDNHVEVGSGIVVREATEPKANTGKSYYHMNYTGTDDGLARSPLNKRVARFFDIYRNSQKDNLWRIVSVPTESYGKQRADTRTPSFDPTAAYSVTYLALDTYAIGIAPQAISAEYVPNIRESVESLVRKVVEARTDVSVLQNTRAQKQQPISYTPTTLNGWVINNYLNVWLDEFGMMNFSGVVKSGTVGMAIFILPLELRPKYAKDFIVCCPITNTDNTFGRLIVSPSGEVTLTYRLSSSNNYVSFDGIRFRTGQ